MKIFGKQFSQNQRVIVKKYVDQSLINRTATVRHHTRDGFVCVEITGTGETIFVKPGDIRKM